MKNRLCIAIIFLIILWSCAKRSSSSNQRRFAEEDYTQIDIMKNDKVSIYDLFSKIDIIPLETTDNSLLTFLIGEPDRIVVSEGKYYFFDEKQQVIIVFNSDGKFLKRIDHQGQGPEEYLSIHDFNINRFNKNIEVLSDAGKYINVYEPSGDTFIKRIQLPLDIPVMHFFHHLTSDTYAFFSCAGQIEMLFHSRFPHFLS